jgi:hypothetical protein
MLKLGSPGKPSWAQISLRDMYVSPRLSFLVRSCGNLALGAEGGCAGGGGARARISCKERGDTEIWVE